MIHKEDTNNSVNNVTLALLNESQYLEIVDHQNDLICRFLPDTTLTFVNKAYCKFFGKTRDELIGCKFLTLIPDLDIEEVKRYISSININNPIASYEHRVINANGGISWHQWTDMAIFNDEDEIIEFQSVGRDITNFKMKEETQQELCNTLEKQLLQKTIKQKELVNKLEKEISERKRTEILLKDQVHFLQVLIDNIPMPIFYKNAEGLYLGGNTSYQKYIGRSSKDLVGKSVFEYYPRELAEIYYAKDNELFNQPGIQVYESRVKHIDGLESDVIFHKATFNDIDGSIAGVIGVVSDITELKATERALQKSEANFRNFIENAPSVIIIFNDREILYANKSTEIWSGYERAELLTMNPIDLLHSEQLDWFRQQLKERKENNRLPFRCELKVIKKNRTEGWVDFSTDIIEYEGNIVYIGVAYDVTIRKHVEEKLIISYDKLQETLQQTVNALASAIELRDPYTAGHQRRVANLAYAIGNEMGMDKEQLDGIYVSALLHDIGKISVPFDLLSKPTKLNDYEFNLIKNHVEVSYDILKKIDFPWPVATIVRQHHEKINGSGYPYGLTSKDMLPEAKILVVADVVEAMSSHRPYRPSLGVKMALDEIIKNKGYFYDRKVVDICLKLFNSKRFNFE